MLRIFHLKKIVKMYSKRKLTEKKKKVRRLYENSEKMNK